LVEAVEVVHDVSSHARQMGWPRAAQSVEAGAGENGVQAAAVAGRIERDVELRGIEHRARQRSAAEPDQGGCVGALPQLESCLAMRRPPKPGSVWVWVKAILAAVSLYSEKPASWSPS